MRRAQRERSIRYYSVTGHEWRVQYDYRTRDGALFSTVARSLAAARQLRDAWLRMRHAEAVLRS